MDKTIKETALELDGIEPTVIDHIVVWFLTWCHHEDTENIGMMELHVNSNVYSEYSEQNIQVNGRTYRAITHSI